jgi:hypothetical protein
MARQDPDRLSPSLTPYMVRGSKKLVHYWKNSSDGQKRAGPPASRVSNVAFAFFRTNPGPPQG